MDRVIDTIPSDFVDRQLAQDWRNRPRGVYYPEGVTDTTRVSVVLRAQDGHYILYENYEAQSFGWDPIPATPGTAGLDPVDVPLTHYKILDEVAHA